MQVILMILGLALVMVLIFRGVPIFHGAHRIPVYRCHNGDSDDGAD